LELKLASLVALCCQPGVFTDLGIAAKSTTTVAAADGHDGFIYGATKSTSTGLFYKFDKTLNKVVYTHELTDAQGSWSLLDAGADVYISTYYPAKLFKYTKKTGAFVQVAKFSGDTMVWSMAFDGRGGIVIGTHPYSVLYRYDMARMIATSYGRLTKVDVMARSVAAHNGYAYVGTGTSVPSLIRVNLLTGEKLDMLPVKYKAGNSYVDGVTVIGDKLFVTVLPAQTVIEYNLNSGVVKEVMANYDDKSIAFASIPNSKWFSGAKGTTYQYNVKNDRLTRSGINNEPVYWIGDEMAGINVNSEFVKYSVTGAITSRLALAGVGLPKTKAVPFSFAANNSNVVIAERQMRHYDTKTKKEAYKQPVGEAKAMCYSGNDLYTANYPEAVSYKSTLTKNIKVLSIGRNQNRPVEMACNASMVAVVTEPNYGTFGGALTLYWPQTNAHRVVTGLVEGHTLYSVDVEPGNLGRSVYVGTSVFGGSGALGKMPGGAHVVKYDIKSAAKIFDIVPNVDALAIKSIKLDSVNNVLFVADSTGVVYKIDAGTGRILARHKGEVIYNLLVSGGLVYAVITGAFGTIDPTSLKFTKLRNISKVSKMALDAVTSEIYLVDNYNLIRYKK
jgi:hypothetical protein